MKIKHNDSVYKVVSKYGVLLEMASAEFTDKVRAAKVKPYFRTTFGRKIYPKYDSMLTGCTMHDLKEMQYDGDLEQHFYAVMKIMLGVEKINVLKLSYIQTLKLYIETCETAKKIYEKFNSLDFPMTQEEKAAQYPRRNLGLFDLVRTFCKLMPMYNLKQAWAMDWEAVFVELEANRADILTQRRLSQQYNK